MSAQPFRLASGGRVDRGRPLNFTYDGRPYTGVAGDTLASALFANGIRLVGRSFKYHRPRGVMTAGSNEPNAIVQLETGAYAEPNSRATQVELYEGLTAASQNCWPSVQFDVAAWTGRVSGLFPAGFYYKTFMWPASAWMRYEYFIRRMAGLGSAPRRPDPDRYEKFHTQCDVLVVGGGPAGLAAALTAGRVGARVILADEQNELGGSLLDENSEIEGKPALDWVAEVEAELATMPEVRVLVRSTAYGYYDHNLLMIAQRVTDHLGPRGAPTGSPRQILWKVRAKEVVLAAGAHERPLVFPDNDRPGVMLASAARAYINRYAVRPGGRAIFFTNNDSAYSAALDLHRAGIDIAAIVDARAEATGALPTAAREAGLTVLDNHVIVATHGAKQVRGATAMALNAAGDGVDGAARPLGGDLLCMAGGWSPVVHLFSQSRGRLRFDSDGSCFVPGDSVQAERSAGACGGTFRLEDCLREGFAAGADAARSAGLPDVAVPATPAAPEPETMPARALWETPTNLPSGKHRKRFVDFQNDVSSSDVELAAREGYLSVEHLKRYTTLGMGTDQGKLSNVNALAIFSRCTGHDIPALGVTTFRPPYTPVTLGLIGGRDIDDLFDPVRKTPMHEWHVAAGAAFEDVGQWKRPYYYAREGEDMAAAVKRECEAVGNGVGIADASTLGKLDLRGPDVATVLNWVYTNAWSRLETRRCRYGLMLGENGMVFDDGVTTKLGDNHYLMSTTSGGAAHVHHWLEEWLQCEWLDTKVWVTNVTTQYAVAQIAGPRARDLLAELTSDIDLAREAFPFMSMRTGTVAGIPARVFRISFTGELSYEINVPASYGMALWQALMSAGEKYDITPFGTESMHVLRAEKGFIIVGEETDGTVTPIDLGMDWIVSKRKKDFLGKRSLTRADMVKPDREQLVGLLTEEPSHVLRAGAQIVAQVHEQPPMPMEGHVTSAYYGPRVGRSIAMGLLAGGLKRKGETVTIWDAGEIVRAKVTSPVFYDRDGERMHA